MAAVYAFTVSHKRKWWLAAVALAALVLWLSPGRSLQTTVEGRLYLARIAAGHWREIPIAGYGPGSFEFPFAAWQTDWLRAQGSPPSAAKFAGLVDHAHNDYLEFLIEYGPAGLCAFLGLSGWLIGTAWTAREKGESSSGAPAWAGVAGLLAIACVDFPFHRPAEWCLYWLLLAIPRTACGRIAGEKSRELPTN
jgi:O-antigen ligase